MTLFLAIAGLLVFMAFMVLWSLAWRNQPILAFGIFLGLAGACVLVAVARLSGIQHLPIWLPAVPFAVVAIALLGFGILAWRWGSSGQAER
jgi:hypothetical protein